MASLIMHYLPILASYNWLDTPTAKKFFKKSKAVANQAVDLVAEGCWIESDWSDSSDWSEVTTAVPNGILRVDR